MRVVSPLSRKTLSRQGFVLTVARDLAHPFAAGDVVADTEHRYTVVSVEAGDGPREVQLLVKLLVA